MSVNRIASEIENKTPFFPRWSFLILARLNRYDARLKSGYHTLKGPLSPLDLIKELTHAPPADDIHVRIQAGWTKWDIADELSRLSLVDRNTFLKRVDQNNLEGLLFPETYRFHPKSTLDQILKKLTDQFETEWKKAVMASTYKTQSETIETLLQKDDPLRTKLINLASFVEKESAHDADRPLIARVFFNRLAKK